MNERYDIDFDSIVSVEGYLKWITVWETIDEEEIPKWYKIYHNEEGSYIHLDNEKHYILVS